MAHALRTLDQALALRSDAQRIRRAAKELSQAENRGKLISMAQELEIHAVELERGALYSSRQS
jgi:hypothetical protein